VLALAAVPAASAHAVLLRTEPGNDEVAETSPEQVVLHFDEPVESALGSVRVYDGNGERVDTGDLSRPEPEIVAVALQSNLDRGTYTVAWRAISADSDPIRGAFVFHVQAPGQQPSGIAAEVLEDTPCSCRSSTRGVASSTTSCSCCPRAVPSSSRSSSA
jgi:copper transport protein